MYERNQEKFHSTQKRIIRRIVEKGQAQSVPSVVDIFVTGNFDSDAYIMETKERFELELRSTNRKGVEECLAELCRLGFFAAPASTKFHLSRDGGLVEHSLNVCKVALKIRESMIALDKTLRDQLLIDSVKIAALLHDVCKSDIYHKVSKFQKNTSGRWTDVQAYDVDYYKFPLGHGEKSVIMVLQSGLQLTKEEMLAIRWHMHAWELPFQSHEAKSYLNAAQKATPLVTLIQTADALASNLLE